MPIRKDDEVLVVRGKYKGREGKVIQVSGHTLLLERYNYQDERKLGSSYIVQFTHSQPHLVLFELKVDRCCA